MENKNTQQYHPTTFVQKKRSNSEASLSPHSPDKNNKKGKPFDQNTTPNSKKDTTDLLQITSKEVSDMLLRNVSNPTFFEDNKKIAECAEELCNKLFGTVHKLMVTGLAPVYSDLKEINEKIADNKATIDEIQIDNVSTRNKQTLLERKLIKLEKVVENMQNENKTLRDENVKLRINPNFQSNADEMIRVEAIEAHKRQWGLKFFGFPENSTEAVFENCAALIKDFIQVALQMPDFSEDNIDRTHRLGPFSKECLQKPRPIICSFLGYKWRDLVLRNRKISQTLPADHKYKKIVIRENLTKERLDAIKKLLASPDVITAWTVLGNLHWIDSQIKKKHMTLNPYEVLDENFDPTSTTTIPAKWKNFQYVEREQYAKNKALIEQTATLAVTQEMAVSQDTENVNTKGIPNSSQNTPSTSLAAFSAQFASPNEASTSAAANVTHTENLPLKSSEPRNKQTRDQSKTILPNKVQLTRQPSIDKNITRIETRATGGNKKR